MTESVAMADELLATEVSPQLKRLGVKLILDDFGTGNCSLTRLKHLPVDAVKIGRALVGGMLGDRTTSDIVELIITMAQKMNLKVMAQGIESALHVERLRKYGCEFGQGYLFSRPLDAESVGRFLLEQGMRAKADAARSASLCESGKARG
jgi:EAL domain-containing protein (putative c-di-GMP-specific phosphodiesterase class I)